MSDGANILSVNTISLLARGRCADSQVGDAGTPMGAAPAAYTLWQRFPKYDPAAPESMNCGRFVLSVGLPACCCLR